MGRSKEKQKVYNDHKQQMRRAKVAAAKAAKAAKKAASKPPVITEADLLAFQLAHFADDTCPDHWFVDAHVALDYDPADGFWEEEDDGLGCYEDGVRRTLTDEQIEMFRHSELEQMAREERLAREEQGLDDEDDTGIAGRQHARSPLSDASSMDEELVGLATSKPAPQRNRPPPLPAIPQPKATALPAPSFASTKRSNSSSTKASGKSDSSKPARPMKKIRKEEVPYEQRHKRKWEEHIATVDPVKGTWIYESKTENRLRREMDNVQAESVELDY